MLDGKGERNYLERNILRLLFFFFQVYYERFQNVQKVWRRSTVKII